jgi:transposase-like protein
MMTATRQTSTAEFTCEAVRLVTEPGYGVGEAARNWGLNAHMLQGWKRELAARDHGVVPGKGRLAPDQAA